MKDRAELNKVKAAIRKSLKRMKITRLHHVVDRLARRHMKKGGTSKNVTLNDSLIE